MDNSMIIELKISFYVSQSYNEFLTNLENDTFP